MLCSPSENIFDKIRCDWIWPQGRAFSFWASQSGDRKLIVAFYVKITFYLDWIKTEKREIFFTENLRSEKQTYCR